MAGFTQNLQLTDLCFLKDLKIDFKIKHPIMNSSSCTNYVRG